MKRNSKILDSISGYLFLTGFITSKLKNIPIAIVAAILNLVSLFAYLIGYIAWYVAALFYPDYPRKHEQWYGFADFKDQYQIAALLGTIATIMCMLAPPLIVPTAWVYTISNLVWAISEHHKKENPPPDDDQFSSVKQTLYSRYAALVAYSSALTAIAATIAVLFPPAAIVVITGSTVIGIGLTVASLYYWGKCAFGNYPPDNVSHSYSKLSDQLSFPLDHVLEPAHVTAPAPQKEKQRFKAANDVEESNGIQEGYTLTCRA